MLKEISVAEQRYQAVLAVLEDGLTVIEVADKMGVSRQSVHAWLRRYGEGGLDALADRSHRPRSCPHQMDPAVQVQLVELRQLHPIWGPDRLLYRLAREGVDPLPSRAAVGRALTRLGLVNAASRKERKRKYRRWERGRPMELWQFDVMGGILLTDGTELKAVTGVDDHSRFCVAVGLVERATSRPVCAVFAAALQAHGVCRPKCSPTFNLGGATIRAFRSAGGEGSVSSGTCPSSLLDRVERDRDSLPVDRVGGWGYCRRSRCPVRNPATPPVET